MSKALSICGGFVLGFGIAVQLLLLCTARPRIGSTGVEIDYSYTRTVQSFPVVHGWPLKMVANLYTSSFGNFLTSRGLLENKYYQLVDLANKLPAGIATTLQPWHRLTGEEYQESVDLAEDFGLEKTVEMLSTNEDFNRPGERYKTVRDYAAAYRDGSTDPVQVAEQFLENVKKLDHLKAFVTVDPAGPELDVLAQARASKERFENGEPLGIWDGIIVVVKNECDVKGVRTNKGSVWDPPKEPATEDDNVVRVFREAGAIIAGVTLMTEFGMSPIGWNPHHQGAFNPYNTGYHTGGSSSGSALAVAAGLAPVAIGFDGGGSVRLPSSMNGVVGIVGSHGRASSNANSIEGGSSVTKVGAHTANVADGILAFALMSQDHPDPDFIYNRVYGYPGPPPFHFAPHPLSDLRIGYFEEYFLAADPHIVKPCKDALDWLVSQGAQLVDVKLPNMLLLQKAHVINISSEMGMSYLSLVHDGHDFNPEQKSALGIAGSFKSIELVSANRLRGWMMKFLEEEFKNVDLLITPTMPISVPKNLPEHHSHGVINIKTLTATMMYIFTSNFAGTPAMTMPVGYDEDGLPIGLMLQAGWWQEHKMLRTALALDQGYDFGFEFPPEGNTADGVKFES